MKKPYNPSTFMWIVAWTALVGYVVVVDDFWQTVIGGLLFFIHIRATDFAYELREAEERTRKAENEPYPYPRG